MTDLIHAGVRGMKWRNRKTPMPSQMMGTLGNRIGGTGTLGPRIGGTGRMDPTPTSNWTMTNQQKAMTRARMDEIANLFASKPKIMKKPFVPIDKALNAEQQAAVSDFMKRRGIS